MLEPGFSPCSCLSWGSEGSQGAMPCRGHKPTTAIPSFVSRLPQTAIGARKTPRLKGRRPIGGVFDGGAGDRTQGVAHARQALSNTLGFADEIPGPVIRHPATQKSSHSTPTAAPEGRRGPPRRPGDRVSRGGETQPRSLGESKARSASPPGCEPQRGACLRERRGARVL